MTRKSEYNLNSRYTLLLYIYLKNFGAMAQISGKSGGGIGKNE